MQLDVNWGNGERCFRLTPLYYERARKKASGVHCDALRPELTLDDPKSIKVRFGEAVAIAVVLYTVVACVLLLLRSAAHSFRCNRHFGNLMKAILAALDTSSVCTAARLLPLWTS